MVFRVEKNKNFTVMSNYHLRDKNLSLKAKGLLSWMLSLPDDWDYSLNGMVDCCKEGEGAITNILKELQRKGYVKVVKHLPNVNNPRIHYEYEVYECPSLSLKNQGLVNQGLVNQGLEEQGAENPAQINTNIINTKKTNTKKRNTKNEPCTGNKLFSSKDSVKAIFDYYQQHCTGLSTLKVINDRRQKAVLKILKLYGPEQIKQVLDKAQNSKFLRGETGGTWKCGFDWLFEEKNFVKVLEGNYDKNYSKKNDIFSEANGKVKSVSIDRTKKQRYVEELEKNGEQTRY